MRLPPLLTCAFVLVMISPTFGQEKTAPKKTEEKRVTLRFENAKWGDVLEWLGDQTGMPVISQSKPAGTFTFIGPRGRTYTMNEVVDIINEGLSSSGFRLVRRQESFAIIPADEKIDSSQVPLLRPEDLSNRGRTETVRVVVTLRALTPEDVAPQVKKLLGASGDVSVLGDRLVLQDTVGNLRQVLQTLRDLDDRAPETKRPQPAAQFRKYTLPTGSADSTLRMLQQFFQSSRTLRMAAAGNNTLLVWASPSDQEQIEAILQSIPVPMVEVLRLSALEASQAVNTLKAMFKSVGGLYLEAEPSLNAVIVRGTPEQIAEIKATLMQLGDGPAKGGTRIVAVERGNAPTLAEELKRVLEQMRPNHPVQLAAPGQPAPKPKTDPKNPGKMLTPTILTPAGNKIIVSSDDPEALLLVQELVRLILKGGTDGDFEIIRLRTASATDVAKVLQEAFNGPEPALSGRVRIVADPASNTLLVQASPIDMLSIKRLLAALDVPHGESDAEVLNYNVALKYTKAADIAKIVVDLYSLKSAQPRRAIFSISVDDRTNSVIVRGTQAQVKEIKALIDQLDVPK